MEDKDIIDLYWSRSEDAIPETEKKYGRYCKYIAGNILKNPEDTEECLNDTWLSAWHAMPEARPSFLKAFLGKISRNLALNKYEEIHAKKRGGGEIPMLLDELQETLPGKSDVEGIVDQQALIHVLNQFLSGLKVEERKIFVRRYWYCASIKEIAGQYALSESKVKMTLKRSRDKLRAELIKGEIAI